MISSVPQPLEDSASNRLVPVPRRIDTGTISAQNRVGNRIYRVFWSVNRCLNPTLISSDFHRRTCFNFQRSDSKMAISAAETQGETFTKSRDPHDVWKRLNPHFSNHDFRDQADSGRVIAPNPVISGRFEVMTAGV